MLKNKRPYEYPIVAIDIETSGAFCLESEICELAAVKYFDGKVVGTFQSLIHVSKPMSDFIIGIHGITNDMVKDAPKIQDVLMDFIKFIDNSIIIGHHVQFDLGFLAIEIEKANLKFPKNLMLCSSLLSRNIITESPDHRLQTLIGFLKLDKGTAHRALDDAKACLDLFHKCMERLDSETTIQDLEAMQEKIMRWETFSLNNFMNTQVGISLYEAIVNHRMVEINYHSPNSKKDNFREIYPKGLVLNPDQSFIVATCLSDMKDKRFYLNKIHEVRVLNSYLS